MVHAFGDTRFGESKQLVWKSSLSSKSSNKSKLERFILGEKIQMQPSPRLLAVAQMIFSFSK